VSPCATPDEPTPSKNLYPVAGCGIRSCPRHRWKFDLTNYGRCTTNSSSIHASPEQEDTIGRCVIDQPGRNFSQPTRSGIAFSDQRMTEQRAVSAQGGAGIHACVRSLLKKGALAPAVTKAKGAP